MSTDISAEPRSQHTPVAEVPGVAVPSGHPGGSGGPRRRGRFTARLYHRIFISPSVLVLLVLAAYPLVFIASAALTRSSLGNPFQEFVGAANFQTAVSSPAIRDSLALGTGYAFGVAVASTALGTVTAVALWRSLHAGAFVRTVLLLPMIVPPVVVGILFGFIFSPSGGLLHTLIRRFTPGSGTFAVLSDTTWAIFGVALADVWEWTPLVVLLVFTALLGQQPEIIEAAQLDGASGYQMFRHITLPAVAGTIIAAFMIRLILAFKVFDLVYVMTSGGPGSSTQVPAFLIWRSALQNFDVGIAATITLLLAIVVTVVTIPVFLITKRLRDD
ncbi:carbohydrate ABC transporter permease [Nesterenkonia salmonea]|uniref:carbohydrate ABC transporter permease n=1 Tax=Nesterenkonia salmonea TaxID=1804987 RepID=UPI001FB70786|nr:sugar ABC transporter permease [Nesterenkonia salmonea]